MADLANEQPTHTQKIKLVKVGNKNLLQCLQASLISVMIGRFFFFFGCCAVLKNTQMSELLKQRTLNQPNYPPDVWLCDKNHKIWFQYNARQRQAQNHQYQCR